MKVNNDLGECPVLDLCKMWSGNGVPTLLVNRAQCYRENREGGPEYMLINISEAPQAQGRRGLWARFEFHAASGKVGPTV